jgi:nucleotide-binding universal stress UspA family protein
LLNRPELWLLCGAVLAVAIGGKFFGTYAVARFCGLPKREASALGWLMNTRGLTELIVLNIGLSLSVISPLLFTMLVIMALVIMALVTTFMTSPLLELTYAKRLIRQDQVDTAEELRETESVSDTPIYRILVPVANPKTQKASVQLAGAIAGTQVQTAVVHPLSLVQLQEDYAFESTSLEAERQKAQRLERLQTLIQSLEPAAIQPLMQPIVRVANDVARETVQVAAMEGADLILLGWHRPAFSTNRLGGRVGQILSVAKTDVAVYIDRQDRRPERLLVPYVSGLHSDLGLELALRILVNQPSAYLTVLRVTVPGQIASELSNEFRTVMKQLPKAVRDRISLKVIESSEPLQAVIMASEGADLTIAGASREWGIERQTLGQYTDALACECRSPVLITSRYSQVTSHMAALLVPPEDAEEYRDPSESMV